MKRQILFKGKQGDVMKKIVKKLLASLLLAATVCGSMQAMTERHRMRRGGGHRFRHQQVSTQTTGGSTTRVTTTAGGRQVVVETAGGKMGHRHGRRKEGDVGRGFGGRMEEPKPEPTEEKEAMKDEEFFKDKIKGALEAESAGRDIEQEHINETFDYLKDIIEFGMKLSKEGVTPAVSESAKKRVIEVLINAWFSDTEAVAIMALQRIVDLKGMFAKTREVRAVFEVRQSIIEPSMTYLECAQKAKEPAEYTGEESWDAMQYQMFVGRQKESFKEALKALCTVGFSMPEALSIVATKILRYEGVDDENQAVLLYKSINSDEDRYLEKYVAWVEKGKAEAEEIRRTTGGM
jgi:hypothetical protein